MDSFALLDWLVWMDRLDWIDGLGLIDWMDLLDCLDLSLSLIVRKIVTLLDIYLIAGYRYKNVGPMVIDMSVIVQKWIPRLVFVDLGCRSGTVAQSFGLGRIG